MNFHQLQIFYAVAQRQNITAAASELHLTQPAVSLQVKALEKNLGLPLLERGGSKLRLRQAPPSGYPQLRKPEQLCLSLYTYMGLDSRR